MTVGVVSPRAMGSGVADALFGGEPVDDLDMATPAAGTDEGART